MAKAGAFLMGENPGRKVKDKFVRYGVTAGGIFVLITLVLIFFYLLYVIFPIFSSVKVTEQQFFETSFSDKTQAVAISDHNDAIYRLSDNGVLSVIQLGAESLNKTSLPAPKIAEQLTLLGNTTVVAATLPTQAIFAVGGEKGNVQVVKPEAPRFINGRDNHVTFNYPLGREPVQLDPNGQPIVKLAVSVSSSQAAIIGATVDNRVRVRLFNQKNTAFEPDNGWQSTSFEVAGLPDSINALAITPDTRTAYALSGQFIYVIALEHDSGHIRDVVDVSNGNSVPEQLVLLSGAHSLLISNSDNSLSQWFEVLNEGKRVLTRTRDFNVSDSAIHSVVPEYTRKGFFALQQDGQLSAFYTTVNGAIYNETPFGSDLPERLVISPRANQLLTVSGNRWQIYGVENKHPEIGFASLWQKIWYEGYPEPDYVWQSTSASDEFEPKLSLVPIVFGTFKAAFYAMLFAVPMALAGAIYTAYFMSSKMRNVVKPTVELMEALPTVILGFLAGIWLAPIVENNLAGIMLLIVALPVSIVLAGVGWSLLPGRWRHRIPNGFHILLLMPVIVFIGYACFAVSSFMESWLFAGDVRVYLTNEWGIGYDQRNTLVVGIAMGFAVIPTIFSIAEDAIFSVPGHLTSGSLALGATHWQTLTKVVLLTASPGIFSAIMMGLGRAVGETMIVLMATGNTPIMDWNILEGMRTLSATIAIEMPESEVNSSHYRVMFLAAFVLFVFTFFFNTIAELVRQRLRDKYSSL
ncbi:ABC transporter permease subunit [Photobacterium makurazakiensis]|uniref:ABC transporter permease subunit n=1 Tax=Photobacterium makurazakiensis TaxID=2910234 RepID=UPI003D0EB0A9